MTEAKFTPGPWVVDPCWDILGNTDDGNGMVCQITTDAVPRAEAEANASLIAAAPMLYRYLAEVRKWMDTDEFGPWEAAFCAEIDAVLAKARGEA